MLRCFFVPYWTVIGNKLYTRCYFKVLVCGITLKSKLSKLSKLSTGILTLVILNLTTLIFK